MEMSSVLILVVGLGLLFICNGNMTLWGMEKRRRSSFKGPALYKLCCLIITQPIVYLIILMLSLQTFSCKSIYQTNNQWFLLKNIYINDSMYVRWLVLLCFVLFIYLFPFLWRCLWGIEVFYLYKLNLTNIKTWIGANSSYVIHLLKKKKKWTARRLAQTNESHMSLKMFPDFILFF